MNYYYYKDSRGNVGDDLNAILLPHFFGNIINKPSKSLLVGVGTLINDKLPDSEEYVFFTSGYGYQNPPNFVNKRVTALGFRGPMTLNKMAPYLDVEPETVPLIDGAYLTPKVIKDKSGSKKKIGLIPHVDSMSIGLWQRVADLAGYKLIDPRRSPHEFILQLTECDKVITEAMHGAILADAYRIPWTPYYAYDHINLAKWSDWTDSLSIRLNMRQVTPIYKGDIGLAITDKFKNNLKRAAKAIHMFNEEWTPPPQAQSSLATLDLVLKELEAINTIDDYCLSDDILVNDKVEQLLENIYTFTGRE
jgi:hypothetical protein